MGWKRRFGNRAENDTSPSDETLPEVEDNIPLGRPYLLNNKIYPGVQQQQYQESLKDKAEALRKKEVQLQKIICILLCTIFPLLTTVATILRLWQTGVLSLPSPRVQPCPKDWLNQSQICFHQLPVSLEWSQADQSCRALQASLPNNSNKLNLYLVGKVPAPFWVGMEASSEARNSSSSECDFVSKTATIEKTSCTNKMTGVCTKSRAASLNG